MVQAEEGQEDRFFVLKSDSMATLKEELTNLLDEEKAKTVLFRYGFKSGELMGELLDATENNYLQIINDVLVQTGIGHLSNSIGKNGKKISVEIERSIESKIYQDGWGCHFTRGYLAGFFTTSLGILYYCNEMRHSGNGGSLCMFVLEPQGNGYDKANEGKFMERVC